MSSIKSFKNIKPLFDRILVKRLKAPRQTESGILIPEKHLENLIEGEVLAVGPGSLDKSGKLIPMAVKAGDRVIVPQYGGTQIKINDEDFSMFRDTDIMAKVDQNAA